MPVLLRRQRGAVPVLSQPLRAASLDVDDEKPGRPAQVFVSIWNPENEYNKYSIRSDGG